MLRQIYDPNFEVFRKSIKKKQSWKVEGKSIIDYKYITNMEETLVNQSYLNFIVGTIHKEDMVGKLNCKKSRDHTNKNSSKKYQKDVTVKS